MEDDFLDTMETEVRDQDVARISRLANRLKKLEELHGLLEKQLEDTEKEMRHVAEIDLPEAMLEAGVSSFALTDGTKLAVEEKTYSNIPKDKQTEAYAWLRNNGFADIIKTEIKVPFNRGDDAEAIGLKDELKAKGIKFAATESVHYQTLNAFVREQLERGTDLPMDLITVHKARKAVVLKK